MLGYFTQHGEWVEVCNALDSLAFAKKKAINAWNLYRASTHSRAESELYKDKFVISVPSVNFGGHVRQPLP